MRRGGATRRAPDAGQRAINARDSPLRRARSRSAHRNARALWRGRVSSRASPPPRPTSTSSTRKPVTPSSTTSGVEPERKAMTGVPHAIASIMTRPKGSGQSIGKISAQRLAEEPRLLPLVDLADELDVGMGIDQRLDDLVPISLIGAVDLGRHLELYAGARGDLDCAIGALFRGNAAKESEIAFTRLGGEGQQIPRQPVMDIAHPVDGRHRPALVVRNRNQRRMAVGRVDLPQLLRDRGARAAS